MGVTQTSLQMMLAFAQFPDLVEHAGNVMMTSFVQRVQLQALLEVLDCFVDAMQFVGNARGMEVTLKVQDVLFLREQRVNHELGFFAFIVLNVQMDGPLELRVGERVIAGLAEAVMVQLEPEKMGLGVVVLDKEIVSIAMGGVCVSVCAVFGCDDGGDGGRRPPVHCGFDVDRRLFFRRCWDWFS